MEGLTQYGEILREIQFQARESQKDMAERLGVSAGFLSFVMSGRRKVPSTLTDKILRLYNLDVTTVQLLRFAEIEKVEISLRGASIKKKAMAIMLRGKYSAITDDEAQQIREILEGSG
jgi:transcriptional regulator with XRE-family HTH domain